MTFLQQYSDWPCQKRQTRSKKTTFNGLKTLTHADLLIRESISKIPYPN
jgi:hypothetical protein